MVVIVPPRRTSVRFRHGGQVGNEELGISNYELNSSNSMLIVVMVPPRRTSVRFRHGGQVSLLQNLKISWILFLIGKWKLISRNDRKDLEPQKSTKEYKSFTYEDLLLEKQNNGELENS